MSLRVGIVGLPNVGKSTLFNALLKRQQALVANYPFATIEPNVGVVEVPDERLKVLSDISHSGRIVPATVEFVDIAGLVAGAATGAGLGNKFLTHIREVDVILQVMRDFEDSEIVKEGSVDPETDYGVVETELILKDLETVNKAIDSKDIKAKGSEKKKAVVDKLFAGLNEGKPAREILKDEVDLELARDLFLLTAKKEIRVYNVAETDPRLRGPMGDALYISAKVESELSSLDEADAKAYMAELGIKESGLDLLIKKAYSSLGLISFLTTGEMESRAWTIARGTKAPQAAGVIHTDFEKKFIKAKVCDYDKFVEAGGWKEAADKGRVRFEGKEYEMKDGDVVEFMIGG
ncbi:TPA: redox-regulated ATPase YchF [Candidatus Collierbacteria bacterium]|uniref:GTP-binding protein YchF n=1 Tax=Candidatus Collierbacteria bacterium GW2011_GWA2_42_17 TaxID=1618378 RepID=A0A0G0Z370_9BACT|nr:MAG: GTP-binding protein YchF [Candidatus Collierbacteria bacterium GW2011_GWA2_42_17]KKS62175.1 MAG: GTP-binding protein YchF [Candidatus Collierbacteria bacterium GW2011_GWE2_42_48]KKS62391.1 MAG: GTP-binding protein YchF [Candidatus Collierbacteria bacterium GW2011_GWD2_42_50]KKS64806.1 MAG: GTP-binding protein YchF [Candidatus Collierbacteria bacterium GW2011_GWF2_42_51]KKS67189.1 MAG: GTP-binding protein YchF [Candidatus Collierbacteria bacterium GW2011_GWA1_42_60]HAI22741.1 redox-regu